MESDTEVEAYASAAAQAYLEKIDQSFVEHVARLVATAPEGGARFSVLDIGCGPGQIPIMMARRWPEMRLLAIDASAPMIDQARADAAKAGVAVRFEVDRLGPEGSVRLDYPNGAFDLVTCNSVLHHLADPVGAIDEMTRLTKPQGAVLLRDLLRPAAPAYPFHVRFFGRHYAGEMRRLFEASVRSAYTRTELGSLLARSCLAGDRSRVFQRGLSHIGVERPAAAL